MQSKVIDNGKSVSVIYKFILQQIEEEFEEEMKQLKKMILIEHARNDGSWKSFTLPTSLKKRIARDLVLGLGDSGEAGPGELAKRRGGEMKELLEAKMDQVRAKLPFE